MPCAVTIDDGTTSVVMDTSMIQFGLDINPIPGGDSILRFLDGSSAKQGRWTKKQLIVSGEQQAPSGLLNIDYAQDLTVTVQRGSDTQVYTCLSLGVKETWAYSDGVARWTLEMEEK